MTSRLEAGQWTGARHRCETRSAHGYEATLLLEAWIGGQNFYSLMLAVPTEDRSSINHLRIFDMASIGCIEQMLERL